jgi:hypothetical protein
VRNLAITYQQVFPMNEISSKLELLESIFKEANAPILQHFNSGLSKEEILKIFAVNDIPEHPDLIALYQWHNGVHSIYGIQNELVGIIPMGSFPNLNEMLALRKDFLSYDYFEVENRKEYIPFLSGGEDDMHLLRISTGQVYYSSPGIQIYCEPEYHSISSMLDFILNCYKEKILHIHPTEGLKINKRYWTLNEESQY